MSISEDMSTNKRLTDDECKTVASVIDSIVINKTYPGEDDQWRFTMLMFELHKKRFNLLYTTMNSFTRYINDPFSEDAIQELNDRINFAQELVYAIYERGDKEYLPDF